MTSGLLHFVQRAAESSMRRQTAARKRVVSGRPAARSVGDAGERLVDVAGSRARRRRRRRSAAPAGRGRCRRGAPGRRRAARGRAARRGSDSRRPSARAPDAPPPRAARRRAGPARRAGRPARRRQLAGLHRAEVEAGAPARATAATRRSAPRFGRDRTVLTSSAGRSGSARSAATKASSRSKRPGRPRSRSCAAPTSSRLRMSASTSPRSSGPSVPPANQPLVMSVVSSPARRAASRSSGRSCRSRGSPPHTTSCAIPARPAWAYSQSTLAVSSSP